MTGLDSIPISAIKLLPEIWQLHHMSVFLFPYANYTDYYKPLQGRECLLCVHKQWTRYKW